MKATVVRNSNEELRLLLEPENSEDRNLLTEQLESLRAIKIGYDELDDITDVAFEPVWEGQP